MLGVKPGVSISELKAAHRDLAKVWHPDRFLHDPRLQEKAQEKLKEINEAYELLTSGKTPRPSPRARQTVYSPAATRATPPRTGNRKWGAVALFLFVAVFGVTTKALLQRPGEPLREVEAQAEQPTSARPDSNTRSDVIRKPNREESVPEVTSSSTDTPPSQPTAALETVTVTIDPESGLLAKQECPLRSRMTYPRGSEPSGYCNISHAPRPKESRLKSLAEKILPQRRKDGK